MAAVTPNTNQARALRVAMKRIEGFAKQFGEVHRNLARHAAFPFVLTPDLLYQIWANFVPEAPWAAVAHVLLSRLCRQVGYEMYEMDIADRNLLLRELKERLGQKRLDELSEFLLDYVAQRLNGDDPDTQDLAQSQEWAALVYAKPTEVARELALLLSRRVKQKDTGEVLRLAALVETFAEPLIEAGFEPLLVYSYAMRNFVRGDLEGAVTQLNKLIKKREQIQVEVARVSLPIPEQILDKSEDTFRPASTFPRQIYTPGLNLPKFYKACNPSKPLMIGKSEDMQYYIDFSSVRGSKIIESLKRLITVIAPNKPTCQLFTGHIGCGKSTELSKLKAELEQAGFHVVYFESSQDLDMADVDVIDILLSIVDQVSESLGKVKIKLKPGYFVNLFHEIAGFLHTSVDIETEAEVSLGTGKITAKTKENPKLRRRLREYLEPRITGILESINKEILERANAELKRRGQAGLVVIVDNLDRLDIRTLPSGRTLPEYLFVDRGEQLGKLNCHLVYTIPLSLIFSNDCETLKNRLGGGLPPTILPMVPVRRRDGSECEEGMMLLRQMVMARAFPNEPIEKQLELITEVFDKPETLNRLCRISGGHLRNLLGLLFGCLRQMNPPISCDVLEGVIRESRDYLTSSINDEEWDLLSQVAHNQTVRGDVGYATLLRSMFVFEYRDKEGTWFGINPALAETQQFQAAYRASSLL